MHADGLLIVPALVVALLLLRLVVARLLLLVVDVDLDGGRVDLRARFDRRGGRGRDSGRGGRATGWERRLGGSGGRLHGARLLRGLLGLGHGGRRGPGGVARCQLADERRQ